jgi:hypothetical protein
VALEALGLPGLQVLADAEGIAALKRRPGSAGAARQPMDGLA